MHHTVYNHSYGLCTFGFKWSCITVCHSRWMCECSLDSMLVLLHALLSANCAWVEQTVGNNGFQSAAILLLHCMWSILYAVLLFHCFKFPPWSFKNQQVPVSVGIWANVMGTKTLSSDSAKFILEFCLHCLIKIHIWHVQCFRIHKKTITGLGDQKSIWMDTCEIRSKTSSTYKKLYYVQSDLEL